MLNSDHVKGFEAMDNAETLAVFLDNAEPSQLVQGI